MNYILTPEQIINKANQMIGVTEMINKYDVQPQVQMEYAEMVAEELLDWIGPKERGSVVVMVHMW